MTARDSASRAPGRIGQAQDRAAPGRDHDRERNRDTELTEPGNSTHASAIPASVDVRSAALTIIAVLAVIMMLKLAQAMIIPIALSVLISYAFDPIVTWMGRFNLRRPLASALLLVAVVASCGELIYGLRFEATEIVDKLPQAARRVRQSLERERPKSGGAIEQMQKAANELEKAAATASPPPAPGVTRVQVEPPSFNVSDYMVWGSIGIVAALGQLVLVLFLAYFLLTSGDLYRRKLVKIAGPSLSKKRITLQILNDINRQIERFLLVQVFTSALVATAMWLAFRWIGIDQAGVWGILAGIFNSIPYFGPVLVTAAAAVLGFVRFGNVHMALLTAGAAFAITSLDGYFLMPWLTSRAARMNAVAIFVGLLFWSWVWGVWGMLLAVPMLMALKAVCDHVDELKGVGELLGD